MKRGQFLKNVLGGSLATIVGSKLSFATPTVVVVDKIKQYPLTPNESFFRTGDIVKHVDYVETWRVDEINDRLIILTSISASKWQRLEVNRKFTYNLTPLWSLYQEQSLAVPI